MNCTETPELNCQHPLCLQKGEREQGAAMQKVKWPIMTDVGVSVCKAGYSIGGVCLYIPAGRAKDSWSPRGGVGVNDLGCLPFILFDVGCSVRVAFCEKSIKAEYANAGVCAEGCITGTILSSPGPILSSPGPMLLAQPCLHLPGKNPESGVELSKKEYTEAFVGRSMKKLAKNSELTAAKMCLADMPILFTNIM